MAWILISSMALINFAVFSVDVSVLVDVPVPDVVPVTGNVVSREIVGAKAAAKVEGTVVETVGIIV